MTVPTTISREQYATDGVTTGFTIHFPFFDDTDVNAIFVDSGGVSTTLALNTDFTVAGGEGAGGTLTTSSPLISGGTLTAFRDIPYTQEDDYVENDPLPAATLEGGFDRAAMRDQQLKDAVDRSLSFPPTIDPDVSAELPSPVADQVLGWNGAGTALENKNLSAGAAVYSSTANTNLGVSTAEAVTPKGLHDSVYSPNGMHMVPLIAASGVPDQTNGPALATMNAGAGFAVARAYDFDKDTAEYLDFLLPIPLSWDGGNIKFQAVWKSNGVVGAGDVSWALNSLFVADGEDSGQAFISTAVSVDTFLAGVGTIHISPLSGNISKAGVSPAPGEIMFLRFFRNATAGGDTYTLDARLLAVLLWFSTSKGTDA